MRNDQDGECGLIKSEIPLGIQAAPKKSILQISSFLHLGRWVNFQSDYSIPQKSLKSLLYTISRGIKNHDTLARVE